MVHLRPVILALLLALAGPAAAIPSSAPTAQSSMATADNQVYAQANTSSVLTLGEDADETRAFATASIDVGTTLAMETDEANRQLSSKSFETQFASLESKEAQRDLIFRYATQIESRIEILERRQRNARRGFRNDSISPEAYVRTLAQINAEASQLQEELNLVKSYTERAQFPLNDYLGVLDKRLLSFDGELRERTGQTVRGDAATTQIHVSAADNGVVLAAIDEDTYFREIYRSDHRNTDSQGTLSTTRQFEILGDLYPYAMKQAETYGSAMYPNPSAGYNRFVLDFGHGNMQGYLDVGTEQVFRESQQKDLSAMPKGPGVTANESGLVLTVNRSYAGGPMYVELVDNETGEPVEGIVTVDGELVGETTTEGGVWTLSPAGTFNVSASSGRDVVTVGTRATQPTKNYNVTED